MVLTLRMRLFQLKMKENEMELLIVTLALSVVALIGQLGDSVSDNAPTAAA